MKNKIYKYDFLFIGAGLIGAITALALVKKKFKVLVIDKKNIRCLERTQNYATTN